MGSHQRWDSARVTRELFQQEYATYLGRAA